MRDLWSANRKLPAWIGSILFHTILVLLIVFWFSISPNEKAASGDGVRIAIGSIVSQSQAGSRGQSGDTSSSEDDASATAPERFSDVSLADVPVTPALAPGQHAEAHAGAESATDIADRFRNSGSGGAGTGMGDGSKTIHFFSGGGKGTKFVYVLDRSLSMEGTRLRRAKEELIRSFRSLEDLHQFNIIFYNNAWQFWKPGRKLVFASPLEKEEAEQYVWSQPAIGGTYHFDPLKEAIALRPDVIFFLTDGESHDDWTLRLPELERLNSQRGYGAQINVVQFGTGGATDPPSRSLKQLADQNRGQYQYEKIETVR